MKKKHIIQILSGIHITREEDTESGMVIDVMWSIGNMEEKIFINIIKYR